MKPSLALITILALVSSTGLHAQLLDITVNNGQGTSASDYGVIPTSDNTNPDPRVVNGTPVMSLGYVNANCVANKSWDLEAFGYNSTAKSLTYIGGFNPLQANEGISLGDIFLSTGPVTQPNGLSQNTDYSNPGYAYAIHFTTATNGSSLNYTIYKLTSTTQLQTVEYNQNLDSDPYALDLSKLGGATIVATGTSAVSTDTNAQVNTLLNETLFNTPADKTDTTADNYVASFNLSSLNLSSFDANLTEGCGNDDLAGSTLAATPEPRAMYLGFAATAFFLGASLLRRRLLASA